MKDVTRQLLNEKDFGRRPNLNYSRIGLYRAKVKRIFGLLDSKLLTLRIESGGKVLKSFPSDCQEALDVVSAYGAEFFMDIHYSNSGDCLIYKLGGPVPARRNDNDPLT